MSSRPKFRHRVALWIGPRLLALGYRLRGIDVDWSKVNGKAKALRKASRGV